MASVRLTRDRVCQVVIRLEMINLWEMTIERFLATRPSVLVYLLYHPNIWRRPWKLKILVPHTCTQLFYKYTHTHTHTNTNTHVLWMIHWIPVRIRWYLSHYCTRARGDNRQLTNIKRQLLVNNDLINIVLELLECSHCSSHSWSTHTPASTKFREPTSWSCRHTCTGGHDRRLKTPHISFLSIPDPPRETDTSVLLSG